MGEGGASESEDRRADLGIGYDLDTEDIGQAWAHVLAESTQDEEFALLVEEKDSRQHGGESCTRRCLGGKCCCSSHKACLVVRDVAHCIEGRASSCCLPKSAALS